MWKVVAAMICLAVTAKRVVGQTVTGPLGEVFTMKVVASRLSDPWEVTYGPDNQLWVTEARGYRVSRIDPETGTKTLLLDLNDQRRFPRYDRVPDGEDGGKPWPQGGLMGLALHPQLLTGKPYVYLAYVYRFAGADSSGNGCVPNDGGCFFTTRIARYTYDMKQHKLTSPVVLCDTIPAGNDHNSGRLLVAPVNGKVYVFYSAGEMGAGQANNAGRVNKAQNRESYEGKILRFNAEPDNDPDDYDRWIPDDNPFNATRQSAVWTLGHRNAQGLAYAVIKGTGRIYSSEHGPFSDDEINIIERGKNYGHPLVIGFDDGNYDGLAAGITNNKSLPGKWHTTYPLIVSERQNARQIGAAYVNPIKTLYPNSHVFLQQLYDNWATNNRWDWPSEGPSGIDVYTSDAIPGWKHSLLVPTLKGSRLIRLQLDEAGAAIAGDTISYFRSPARYRDVAISADGKKIYLAVDSSTMSSFPSRNRKSVITQPGTIVEFVYKGAVRPATSRKTNSRSIWCQQSRPINEHYFASTSSVIEARLKGRTMIRVVLSKEK